LMCLIHISYAALKVGDAILSINGVVPSSPKDAVRLILDELSDPYQTVEFVVVNSDVDHR
jgi:hypothetical protein